MLQSPPESSSAPANTPIHGSDPVLSSRYSRQVLFAGIGATGQSRLAASRVAIVGVGATGAAAASLLARAGVGYLRLIDRDFVDSSNLQRQILFDEEDVQQVVPKAEAARRKIVLFNSAVRADASIADLTPDNVQDLLAGVDLILDGTDNFETRYLINDFAVLHGVPWIYSAAVGATAATMNILPRRSTAEIDLTPGPAILEPEDGAEPSGSATAPPQFTTYNPTACLACIFPDPPSGHTATCDTAGILGSAVTVAASIQCAEALKWLIGQPHLMRRTLLCFDLWQLAAGSSLEHAEISASDPDPACAVCGLRRFRHLEGLDRPHITLCGRNAVQIHERRRPVALAALHQQLVALSEITEIRSNDMLLRFRRAEHIITVFADGRALIQGTTDPGVARALYARFVGA